MDADRYEFSIVAEDQATATRAAADLRDALREVADVHEASVVKTTDQTMDLGSVVSVLASSAATLAIAQGLAAWLRARRGATVSIVRDPNSRSLKVEVNGLDPEAALRVVEIIRDA